MQPGNPARGLLHTGLLTLPCALGRGGIGFVKREGDGATPRATMTVLDGFFRESRWPRGWRAPWLSVLPAGVGWCDEPRHPAYNRPVALPFAASHETMSRDDELYDCVLVLDWNIRTRARHRGSAIFLHIAKPGFQPTQGCIAVAPRDMSRLLRIIRPGDRITVR